MAPGAPRSCTRSLLHSVAGPSTPPTPPHRETTQRPTQRPLGGQSHAPSALRLTQRPSTFFPAASRPWPRRGGGGGRRGGGGRERGGEEGRGGGEREGGEPAPDLGPSGQFSRPSARWVGALGDPAPSTATARPPRAPRVLAPRTGRPQGTAGLPGAGFRRGSREILPGTYSAQRPPSAPPAPTHRPPHRRRGPAR